MSDHTDANNEQSVHGHDEGHRHATARGRGRATRMALLIVFAVVIAAIAFVGETLGHSRSSSTATITVTGSGTVTGRPNTMTFQVGVRNVAATAKTALAQNNDQVTKLEKALLRHDVTKKNMQTSGLNVYANTNQAGTITGFTVEDDLNVTTHQLKSAGAALDAAASAVGNNIVLNGVTFSISNKSSLLAAARARAMQNAHAEASQIAKGGATTVGPIARVTDQENTGGTGIIYAPASFATAAQSVPIASGSQSLNVQVTVVYHLAS